MGTISQALEARREASGLNQSEWALSVGLRPSSVSQWISGRALPRLTSLPAIADAIGLDIETAKEMWLQDKDERRKPLQGNELARRRQALEEFRTFQGVRRGSPEQRAMTMLREAMEALSLAQSAVRLAVDELSRG